MTGFKASVSALLLLLNVPLVPVWSQPQQSDKPVRIGISLVTLDVSVTDKRRRFVSDLEKKDFVVTEDGVEQNIDSFVLGSSKSSGAAANRGSAGHGKNPAGEAGNKPARFGGYRFISIVVDNSSMEPANRDSAAQAISRFIRDRLQPDDLVAIYSISNSLTVVQPFTGDSRKLLDAVPRSISGGAAADAASIREEANRTAEAAAKTEGTATPIDLADRASRDALVEFSAISDSLQAQALLRSLQAVVDVQRRLTGTKSVVLFTQGAAVSPATVYAVDGVISAANSIGVSIYSINPAGLGIEQRQQGIDPRGMGLPSKNRADPYGGEDPTKVIEGENGLERALKRMFSASPSDRFSVAEQISKETGGISITNNNDLAAAMAAVDDDVRAHYTLTYTPRNQNFDGKYRSIAVRLDRPDLAVRTRTGYYAVKSDAAVSREEPVRKLAGDMLSGIQPAFPLEMSVIYFPRGSASYLLPVMLRLPVSAIRTRKNGDRYQGQIDYVITVKDSSGAVVSTFGRNMTVYLNYEHNEQLAGLMIPIQQRVRLRAGTYVIIAAVRDRESQNTSIARRAITIPDCAEGPCLSSIVMAHQVEQAPASLPQSDLAREVLSFGQQVVLLPTDNSFTTSQPLFLFFRAYSASGARSLIVGAGFFKDGKLVQKTPTIRIDKPSVLTPEGFPLITPFKLADFEPGAYTVRVELVDEATKKRDVKEATFTLVK
jgi:VWFA-related protein